MFKDKRTRVILSEEANEQFAELNKIVGEEIKRGIEKSEHQTLLRSAQRAFKLLKINPFAGIQIKKSTIPKKYVNKYDVTNLWKFDLAGFWRIIYTVRGSEIEII